MKITISQIKSTEFEPARELILRVFREFEAPEYPPRGIEEFESYMELPKMKERQNQNHFILVATSGHSIVGVIEIRNNEHICVLFVDKQFHNQGIAKSLLTAAIQLIKTSPQLPDGMTVNSSPYAVEIYKKFGFNPLSEEKMVNGIRFTPMKRKAL